MIPSSWRSVNALSLCTSRLCGFDGTMGHRVLGPSPTQSVQTLRASPWAEGDSQKTWHISLLVTTGGVSCLSS